MQSQVASLTSARGDTRKHASPVHSGHIHAVPVLPPGRWARLCRAWQCFSPAGCCSSCRCQTSLPTGERFSAEHINCKLPHGERLTNIICLLLSMHPPSVYFSNETSLCDEENSRNILVELSMQAQCHLRQKILGRLAGNSILNWHSISFCSHHRKNTLAFKTQFTDKWKVSSYGEMNLGCFLLFLFFMINKLKEEINEWIK